LARHAYWTIALLIVFLVLGPELQLKPGAKPALPQNFLPLLHWLPGGWWIDKEYVKPLEADKDLRVAGFISIIVLLYPLLAISIKRLHDLNLSGWWCLLGLAPHYILHFAPLVGLGDLHSPRGDAAVSAAWLVVVGFIRGTAGPNSYGPTHSRSRRLNPLNITACMRD
jgi:uncharacterized membrane protein YhaH (DUF805 family)